MIEENYNYNYQVNQINVEEGTFEVEYLPEDVNLSPVRLNVSLLPINYKQIVNANNDLIYASQEEVPFQLHFENTIEKCAPIIRWRNQYLMMNNIDTIHKANGSFTKAVSSDALIWPTGYKVTIEYE